MGHERVGILPRRKRWLTIVSSIRNALGSGPLATTALTTEVLNQVRRRYQRLPQDSGVQAAFSYLVALSSSDMQGSDYQDVAEVNLDENPSPLRITADLAKWVEAHRDSTEYAELACRAAADTIAIWTRQNSQQQQLFDESTNARNIWSNIDGSRFCDISRTFFSKLTERYLCYFIERSASAQASSIEERQRFDGILSSHMEDVSRHAFETAKITQSFAAGWFNKNVSGSKPTAAQMSAFLAIAFGKLQEELLRETGSQ